MNKTALKNFATSARKELIKKVEARALKIGITEESIKKAQFESSDAIYIDGKQLSLTEKKQRDKLVQRIREIGFKNVVEEVAYTWFNRFIALRFMEVNNYVPTKVRVLSSSEPGNPEPDILKEALSVDLDIDKELVYDLKVNNKTEELFKYLIIKQCNNLNKYLPFLFETIEDYKEILFPDGLLAKESFLRNMTDVTTIPESDWEQVEIIGWLYQYYIADEKDRVIKAKKKYETEEIPFATQLFTPDWIVRYMVQNTLGRYWVESHPEHRDLIQKWDFYLENPNRESDFDEKLSPHVNKDLKVEDIKCFDPAMGSGHILVYMFDVLFDIYVKCGYMEREIPVLIIRNNLYGVDIDDRAYQLACFAVVMKALKYNHRFFRVLERDGLRLNLASIQDTNGLTDSDIAYVAGKDNGPTFAKMKNFIHMFTNAKTTGSLIKVKEYDSEFISNRLDCIIDQPTSTIFELPMRNKTIELLPLLLKQSDILTQEYDIVVTNPPYMGNKYMNTVLSDFVSEYYRETKSDTFSSFVEMCIERVTPKGLLGFLTPLVWMFISSYEGLRKKVILGKNISSLIQLEYNAFPEACVPVCTFVLRNYSVDVKGDFIRLSDFTGSENQPKKVLEAIQNPHVDYRYHSSTKRFSQIQSAPIVYWASDKILEAFESPTKVSTYGLLNEGVKTRDNERFLRLWFEVDHSRTDKWKPYSKGGGFKKWYGNNEYVINWENDGKEVKEFKKSSGANSTFYFQETLTWSAISSYKFSVRYITNSIFGGGGSGITNIPSDKIFTLLGLLNTSLANETLNMLSSTLNYEVGSVSEVPVILNGLDQDQVNKLVANALNISKEDWDSYEESWDFKTHPLLLYKTDTNLLEDSFQSWDQHKRNQFQDLKSTEENLNRLFNEVYEVDKELTPEVIDEDITIRACPESIKGQLSECFSGPFQITFMGIYSLEIERVRGSCVSIIPYG